MEEASGENPISQQWYAGAVVTSSTANSRRQIARNRATELPTGAEDQRKRPDGIRQTGTGSPHPDARSDELKGEIDPFVHGWPASGTPNTCSDRGFGGRYQRQDLAIHVITRIARRPVLPIGMSELDTLRKTDPAFVQALVRQESAFDPKAISRARPAALCN